MRLHGVLRQRQPQPRAGAAARPVRLVEPLEDPRQVLRRDPGTRVLDRNFHAVAVRRRAERDAAAGRRELDRVVQEVHHHTFQRRCVAHHRRQRRRHEYRQRQARTLRLWAQALGRGLQNRRQVHRRPHGGQLARLQARQLEQLLHHRHQAVQLGVGARQEVLGRSPLLERAPAQRLDHRLHGGQRRPQLVGDVGHEVAAHTLRHPHLGHVVEDGHRRPLAPVQNRGRGHFQVTPVRPLDDHRLPPQLFPAPAQRLNYPLVGQRPDERLAD